MVQGVVPFDRSEVLSWAPTTRSTSYIGPPLLQQSIVAALDLVILALTFIVSTSIIRTLGHPGPTSDEYLASVWFAMLWILVLWIFGSYAPRHARAGATEYKRAVNASIFTAGAVGTICYLLEFEYPRALLTAWFAIAILDLAAIRFGRRRLMHRLHRSGRLVTPVIMAGSTKHVDEIAKVLKREDWLGYHVQGVLTDEKVSITLGGLPVLGSLDHLPSIVDSHRAPVVVFAEGSFESSAQYRRLAWQLEKSHVRMILAPTLADVSAERLDFFPVAGLPLVDVAPPTAMKSLRRLKRSVDALGAALLLLLASPFLLATMIAIKLEDGGPIVFRQRRVGLDGEEFECLKLRSMCVDAEAKLAEIRAMNEGAGLLFKMKDDPRITRIGKFIRRYSIDELPQLWNVLVGDMSLVGPRPALPSEVEQYDSDTRRRLRVRPGLTGLWQVSGRSSLSWEDTVRLDLYYVDNWSLVQDGMILLRTARAVVGSSGAY